MGDLTKRIDNFIKKQIQPSGLYPKKITEQVTRGGKTFMRTRTVMVKPERHFIETLHEKPHEYVDALANAIPWGYGTESKQKIAEGTKNLRPIYRMLKQKGENEAASGVASTYWLLKKGKIHEAEQRLGSVKDLLSKKYPKPKEVKREGRLPHTGPWYS